jgi:tellurite resistance protein TerC
MIWFWVGFIALVVAFLAIDLGVFHRKAHVVSMREALTWSAVWISTSLLFSVFIYAAYDNHWYDLGRPDAGADPQSPAFVGLDGAEAWLAYVTGYVVEWSLSVDNIFVIALIFGYFRIPAIYQHRVLFWGIIGAVVMRGIFIALGTAIIESFHWVIYVFGVFLIFTAYKMLSADDDPDPGKSRVVQFVRRHFNVTDQPHGQAFLVKLPDATGRVRTWLTPLAMALIVVEVTDLIFAVDSIPAIFGITQEPFIVFTSNIFAVMGLRSMYFALAGLLHKFHLLKTALALILGFVGVKMLAGVWIEEQLGVSHNAFALITLGVILTLLAGGVVASLAFPKKRVELVTPADSQGDTHDADAKPDDLAPLKEPH